MKTQTMKQTILTVGEDGEAILRMAEHQRSSCQSPHMTNREFSIEAMRPNRLMSARGNRRQRSLALLCWLLFAAGLLVQLFSPHLKVSNRAFVIPPEISAGKNAIRPDELVSEQRRMQVLSALLTLSGALGLVFLYRGNLVGAVSRRSSEPVEVSVSGIPRQVSTQTRHEKFKPKKRRDRNHTNQHKNESY